MRYLSTFGEYIPRINEFVFNTNKGKKHILAANKEAAISKLKDEKGVKIVGTLQNKQFVD
jgi:hypothetical protein